MMENNVGEWHELQRFLHESGRIKESRNISQNGGKWGAKMGSFRI